MLTWCYANHYSELCCSHNGTKRVKLDTNKQMHFHLLVMTFINLFKTTSNTRLQVVGDSYLDDSAFNILKLIPDRGWRFLLEAHGEICSGFGTPFVRTDLECSQRRLLKNWSVLHAEWQNVFSMDQSKRTLNVKRCLMRDCWLYSSKHNTWIIFWK